MLTRDGTWFDVPHSDDLLYVLSGDTSKLVTHDIVSEDGESLEIPATTHRVTGTVETAVHGRSANVMFVNLDMTKAFRSAVTGDVIRYRDPVKNIDVALDPAMRLLHARLRANGTLAKSDSFEDFARRAANLPQRLADLAPNVPHAIFFRE